MQRFKEVVLEQNEWLPILIVGEERIRESGFTDEGVVYESPGWLPASEMSDSLQAGWMRFGPRRQPTGADSRLTAEWIEYEIHCPGENARTIRREIFDLIGASLRSKPEAPAAPPFNKDSRTNHAYPVAAQRSHMW